MGGRGGRTRRGREKEGRKRKGERGKKGKQEHLVMRKGGFGFAVQPHREVRPESGLVGIVEHIEVNKR